MIISQTSLCLIIHLDFYILLPLSYHFPPDQQSKQCRAAECSQPQAQHVKCLTGGSHPPAPSIPSGGESGLLDRHVSSNMKEHGSQPSFPGWQRAEGPEAAARHSPSQQGERPALFWRASREWPHLLPESVHVSSCKLGAFCAATRAAEH